MSLFFVLDDVLDLGAIFKQEAPNKLVNPFSVKKVLCDWDLKQKAQMLSFGFSLRVQNNCSEFKLQMTRLYIVFQSNVNFSLDSCICHHKMSSDQIFPLDKNVECPQTFLLHHWWLSQCWIFTLGPILTVQNLSCRRHNFTKFFSWMLVFH